MQLKGHRISTLPKAELERAAISVVYPFNDAEVEESIFPLATLMHAEVERPASFLFFFSL